MPAVWAPGEGPLCLLRVSSQDSEGKQASSRPNCSLEPHLEGPAHQALGLQHRNFEGRSVCNTRFHVSRHVVYSGLYGVNPGTHTPQRALESDPRSQEPGHLLSLLAPLPSWGPLDEFLQLLLYYLFFFDFLKYYLFERERV